MTGKVKIEPIDDSGRWYDISVDGKKVDYCTGMNFSIMPGELPEVDLEINSALEFEGEARVAFRYSPEAIETAKKIIASCLDNEDEFSDELFGAFADSVDPWDADAAYEAVCEFFGAKGYK